MLSQWNRLGTTDVHMDHKCPYVKNEISDDEEDNNIKKERKPHQ
jgi:hypothetical protein